MPVAERFRSAAGSCKAGLARGGLGGELHFNEVVCSGYAESTSNVLIVKNSKVAAT
jgi:hypothetical protein